MNISATQTSDISNALPMKNDDAVIAKPPMKGINALCRQP